MKGKPIAAGKSSFDLVDVPLVFKEIGLNTARSFLDIACGIGRYALAAAPVIGPGGIVYAIDLWEEGITALHEAIKTRAIDNIEPIHGDVSKRLPFDDHSIDICFMATVLHDLVHDNTAKGALPEISRVLRRGGRLALIEFKKIAGGPAPPIEIRLAPEQIESLLFPYGFVTQKLFDTGTSTYCMVLSAPDPL